ncbi:MAG: nitroreductase family protein [Candidatus Aenigmarchaeota archaeon]|nr:nitroreductase family protein [Candidatus Aenigmarchaeota archaeon]
MEAFDALFNRKSIRKFKQEPIDDRLIGLLIYTATQAPSAGNTQEWRFIVVKDEKKKKKLAEAAYDQKFIAEAPVIIVVCGDEKEIKLAYGKRGKEMYLLLDTAAAIENLLLAVHAAGLGSCWVSAFDDEHVSHILDLPPHIRPIAILPIGYPAEDPEKPSRLPLENVTYSESYGSKFKEPLGLKDLIEELMREIKIKYMKEDAKVKDPIARFVKHLLGK